MEDGPLFRVDLVRGRLVIRIDAKRKLDHELVDSVLDVWRHLHTLFVCGKKPEPVEGGRT